MVKRVHGRLQILIGVWFEKHEDQWGLEAAAEVRAQVSPTRVRLPDVVVYPVGTEQEILIDPPPVVIEIYRPATRTLRPKS